MAVAGAPRNPTPAPTMRTLIPLLALILGVVVFFAIATGPKGDPSGPDAAEPAGAAETAAEAFVADEDVEPSAETDAPVADGVAPAETTLSETAPVETMPAEAGEPDGLESADAGTDTDTTGQTAAANGAATSGGNDGGDAGTYKLVTAERPVETAIGGLTPDGAYRLEAEFTPYGAGLKRVRLADFAESITNDARYTLLDAGQAPSFYTLAASNLRIDGQVIRYRDTEGNLKPISSAPWERDATVEGDDTQSDAVTYRLAIVDDTGQPVADLVRTWSLDPDSYELRLDQRVINRTGRDIKVTFDQYGVGDLLMDRGAYIGDQRQLITGYFGTKNEPKSRIFIDDAYWKRGSLAGDDDPSIWPNRGLGDHNRLAWVAAENRYFALVTHLPLPEAGTGEAAALTTADLPEFDGRFPRLGVRVHGGDGKAENADVITTYGTAEQAVAPGQTLDLSMDVYAGPRKSEIFALPPYDALNFDELIRYELGCTWCTFQWLAHLLLGYLKLLHALVFDWGVAIILLVLTVRILLHPITKRAQGNMMKMSKQMATIQPEMQKLKEKYKDDPSKMNAEVMKLYKEKGVNPLGMLGCLPMLLQTPIWIALYAMLYLAIELRHESAFYGVFQAISGDSWKFLADLSVSDRFIPFFDEPRYFNLLFLKLDYSAFNILPILMAVVFFFNMKFTTPPAQTEEQRQQQKIMRIMPFIFPIFLYSAPAGLTLYITASTLAGIVDSYLVRRHIKQQEEAGTLFDKKEVKEGSFRWKMQQRLKLAQEMAAAKMEEQQKGRKNVQNTAQGKGYKNRKKK